MRLAWRRNEFRTTFITQISRFHTDGNDVPAWASGVEFHEILFLFANLVSELHFCVKKVDLCIKKVALGVKIVDTGHL